MKLPIPGLRNPADFVGGIGLVVLAAMAYIAAADLPQMVDYRFTAGTMPRISAILLACFGLAIVITAFFREGDGYPIYSMRGPLIIAAGVVLFALTVKPFGLLLSSFVLFCVTASARPNTRWIEVIVAGIVMSAGCVLLFIVALKLPYPIWPGTY